MSNILIDLLPSTVKIEGTEYKINSNFRTSVLFSLLMEDEELTEKEKINQIKQEIKMKKLKNN